MSRDADSDGHVTGRFGRRELLAALAGATAGVAGCAGGDDSNGTGTDTTAGPGSVTMERASGDGETTANGVTASAHASISGTVRGVFDGYATLDVGDGDPRRDALAVDDVSVAFDDVPAGEHTLRVSERDAGNGTPTPLVERSVEAGDAFDVRLDTVRGVFAVPKSLEEMRTELDRYADLGITDLYLRTLHLAQTVFPSEHAPQKSEFDEDYFGTVLREAHERNIRVHAWLHAHYWWNAKYLGDVPEWHPLAGDDELDYRSPSFDESITLDRERVTAREDGTVVAENGKVFASPFDERTRGLLVDVVKELVAEYDVDGVNLDYIRFPGFRYYDADGDGDREFVGEPYGHGPSSPIDGDASYEEAQNRRIEAVTDVVEAVGGVVPVDVVLSADVFNSFYTDPESGGLNRNKAQDWQSWIGATEIDWLHPMVYESVHGFDELTAGLAFAFDAEEAPVTILPGLTNINDHASITEQYERSLSEFDVSGYLAFKGETIETMDDLP